MGVPVGTTGSHVSCPLGIRAAHNTREVRVSGYENNWSEDGFENEAQSQGGGGLRKMLEDTLAENRRLAALLNSQREADATALLKDKGIDPAFAELIPQDADPKEWIDKYGPLIGVKQEVTPVEEEKQKSPEVRMSDDNNDPAIVARRAELAAEREVLEEMQHAAEEGLPASVHDDLLNQMEKIESEEELLKFFKQNGAPVD